MAENVGKRPRVARDTDRMFCGLGGNRGVYRVWMACVGLDYAGWALIRMPLAKIASRYLPARVKMLARQVAGALNDPPSIESEMCDFHGNVAADVGAWDGRTTRLLLERFKRVYAFEPFFNMKLDRLKDERLTVVWMAAGSVPGLMTGDVRYGQFSKLPHKRISRYAQATSLDYFFAGYGAPDFVKVDVEGFEREVIEGAKWIISLNKTTWFIEIHRSENERAIRVLFPSSVNTRLMRHPNYKRGSYDWFNHYWIVIEP